MLYLSSILITIYYLFYQEHIEHDLNYKFKCTNKIENVFIFMLIGPFIIKSTKNNYEGLYEKSISYLQAILANDSDHLINQISIIVRNL